MLKKLLYLDAVALEGYLSAIEGGVTTSTEFKTARESIGRAGLGAKILTVGGEKQGSSQEVVTRSDTDDYRLDRLIKAGHEMPTELAWIDVINPNDEFLNVGIGALIHWECEVYIPPYSQMLSRAGELNSMLDLMERLEPVASLLNFDMAGLPSDTERSGLRDMIDNINAPLVLVGDSEGIPWKIVGTLFPENIRSEPDGVAQVIGKVSKRLRHDQWQPLSTLPGMKLLSRDERRARERTKPNPEEEDQYIQGPLLVLDLLAVYR